MHKSILLFFVNSNQDDVTKCCKKGGVPLECMGICACKASLSENTYSDKLDYGRCQKHLDKITDCRKSSCGGKQKNWSIIRISKFKHRQTRFIL